MHRFGLREICPDDFVMGFFKRYHIPQTEGAAGIVGERGDHGANRIEQPAVGLSLGDDEREPWRWLSRSNRSLFSPPGNASTLTLSKKRASGRCIFSAISMMEDRTATTT